MSRDKPVRTGIHIFKGIRLSPGEKFIYSVHNFVEVRDDPAYPEWIVKYIGTSNVYRLSQHRGSWKYVGDMLNE